RTPLSLFSLHDALPISRRIVFGHPHDESPGLRDHARTTAAPLRVRPFARDELPMPAENRIGRHDRGDTTQAATTHLMSAQDAVLDRKSTRLNSSHQISS